MLLASAFPLKLRRRLGLLNLVEGQRRHEHDGGCARVLRTLSLNVLKESPPLMKIPTACGTHRPQ